jgi:hypothetical protein
MAAAGCRTQFPGRFRPSQGDPAVGTAGEATFDTYGRRSSRGCTPGNDVEALEFVESREAGYKGKKRYGSGSVADVELDPVLRPWRRGEVGKMGNQKTTKETAR